MFGARSKADWVVKHLAVDHDLVSELRFSGLDPSQAALARELRRLLFDRGEQRGPVRAECACSVALEMFGKGVGVDPGVGCR